MYRMEQDLDTGSNTVCSTCLSSNRNVFPINNLTPVYQIFRLLMYNFVSEEKLDESINEMEHLVCWECMALMKKFAKFKEQVQCVQEHIRVLSYGTSHENTDHTYLTQSLSSLRIEYKTDYDRIYLDSLAKDVNDQQKTTSLASSHKVMVPIHDELQTELKNVKLIQNNLGVDFSDGIIAPENDLENSTDGDMSNAAEKDDFVRCDIFTHSKSNTVQMNSFTSYKKERSTSQSLSESSDDNQHNREEEKRKVQYVNSVYKCELCIVGFYSQQQVEDHFISMHKPTSKKKTEIENKPPQPKLGDLRKLLLKNTIEGYQCLKCDMFFKTTRARRTHVARYHGDGVHCDHCKKRFVNKTSLRVHLRLHEGPLPRQECPICHKMVRVIRLKYHIQWHKNKSRYECTDCNKVFSYLTTFQAHLKYARAHASKQVFTYKCSICDKGYRLKSQLRDHTNYQHLGKTQHKCPICDKALATSFGVTNHVRRAHENVKESPREKLCQQCGKAFKTNKRLREHELIHTGERPLSCEICGCTFRQSASLYTHRKRVHNIRSSKKNVQLVED